LTPFSTRSVGCITVPIEKGTETFMHARLPLVLVALLRLCRLGGLKQIGVTRSGSQKS
jgi:hypothetical protein